MQNLLISVVIPVYNVERYLRQCLDSVIAQYDEAVEIILVNDGSTDSSAAICREYTDKYTYIHLVEQSNAGLSEARNTGIRNASGDYIAFLDSDDYFNDRAIERLLTLLSKKKVDLLFGKTAVFYDDTQELQASGIDYSCVKEDDSPSATYLKLRGDPKFRLAAWLLVVNRKFLLENKLFFKKGILHEDMLWVPQVFALAENSDVINYDFYVYRLGRNDSIMNTPKIKGRFDALKIIDELNEFSKGLEKEKMEVVWYRMASLEYSGILYAHLFEKDSRFEELWSEIDRHIYALNFKKYKILFYAYRICGNNLFRKLWAVIRPKKELQN